MSFYVELAALLLSIVILYVLYRVLKELAKLLINSVAAVILLFLVNLFLGLGIAINIWSVAIVAISGLPGLVLVIILHFLGLAF